MSKKKLTELLIWIILLFSLYSFFAISFWASRKNHLTLLTIFSFFQIDGFLKFACAGLIVYSLKGYRTLYKLGFAGIGILFVSFAVSSVYMHMQCWPLAKGTGLLLILVYPCVVGIPIVAIKLWHENYYSLIVKIDQERILTESLEQKTNEAALRLLHTQLDTTFITDRLKGALEIAHTDISHAIALQNSVIDYLRAILPHFTSETVSIPDQLEILKRYIDILKVELQNFTYQIRLQIPSDSPLNIAHNGPDIPKEFIKKCIEIFIRHGDHILNDFKVLIDIQANEIMLEIKSIPQLDLDLAPIKDRLYTELKALKPAPILTGIEVVAIDQGVVKIMFHY